MKLTKQAALLAVLCIAWLGATVGCKNRGDHPWVDADRKNLQEKDGIEYKVVVIEGRKFIATEQLRGAWTLTPAE